MTRSIVLDSGTLGLIVHKAGIASADECKSWFQTHIRAAVRFYVPAIADYELRRELLRLKLSKSIQKLNDLALLPTCKV